MRTAAAQAIDALLATHATTRESRELSITIRALRENFRAELGITEQ